MDINQLKQKFIAEAETLLTSLDNTLIELEKDKGNEQHIGEAFRVMHTIKGASGMFGFDKVVEITHELESLYDLVRDKKVEVVPELIEISFSAADHIRALLYDEKFENPVNIEKNGELRTNLDVLKAVGKIEIKRFEPKRPESIPDNKSEFITWHILFYPSDEIIDRAINLVYTFHDLLILGEYKIQKHPFQYGNVSYWSIFLVTDKGYDQIEEALLFIMDYCKIHKIADFNIFDPNEFKIREGFKSNESITVYQPISNSQNTFDEDDLVEKKVTLRTKDIIIPSSKKTSHINVESGKLDTLMYLVSELVTTKSELLSALNKDHHEKAINAGEKIEKLTKLFSENALNLRLVSILEITEKFKRLIRDLAKQLDKQINFVTDENDTELDKSIIDHIGEPVMHLIRNCIDHGIELPDVRKARGKNETGTIRFETVKSGNYVYIFISDDGNGIDTEYIYKKAVDNGFVSPGTQLSEKEIFDLIFLPGFSTAQNLSNVSGRGVGMDIVLNKIREIRGEITITSNKGTGTTFSIKLQQTISIIDTLLVKASNIIYAIPVEDIDSCILEAHENLIDRQNHLFNFNGELIPYMFIETPDYISNSTSDSTDKLVVIKKHDKTFALVVDNIVGEYQAVIKPLGHSFNEIKFLSGASLLGDGSIALLIDTDKLWLQPSEIN